MYGDRWIIPLDIIIADVYADGEKDFSTTAVCQSKNRVSSLLAGGLIIMSPTRGEETVDYESTTCWSPFQCAL